VWRKPREKEIKKEMDRLNIGENGKQTKNVTKNFEVPTIPRVEIPKAELPVEVIEKYETEIRLLRERLLETEGSADASKNIIKGLSSKLKEYEASNHDQLNLEQEVTILRTENRLIRDLLKFWM
jgi:CRISPR/Cas system Type II protein with McrA/HNH and RuvC-like nuclease domain